MTLVKTLLASSLFCAVSLPCFAADPILDEEDSIKELPNKKLERRGERMQGPITSIGAAAMLFASFDTNSDYQVNALEFAAGRTQAFNAADKDSSKTLSLFELEDWRQAALGSLDAAPGNLAFDKDYDQRVTRAEFDHALGFVFNAGDKDNNGVLAFSEVVNVFEMPRRRAIEKEEDPIERINRQGRRDQQRRTGY